MPSESAYYKNLKRLMPLALLVIAQIASGQSIPILLRLQRSTAEAAIDQNRQSMGNNVWDAATGDPRDVWKYPNTAACLVVYNDGKYAFEKREEHTLGHPKIKSEAGVLAADDLQQLKSILENEDLKKITTPKAPELPADTQVVREIETLDAQIGHEGTVQRFTFLKERVKTGALISATSSLSTGMDTYLDNGAPYKKTLNPLMKWFEELQKKSKSTLKESKPQYCVPMNIR
ncbi:MAG: hypothetical protein LAO23_21385 [Acidobacteriia bacterium]|nr:hypothetical protein [Terriglobia bacterium]